MCSHKDFQQHILSRLIICLLSDYFINAGQVQAAFGEWQNCPAFVSTYAGCNVTLKAYFNVKDNNIMCSDAYIQFGITDAMTNLEISKTVSFGVNGSNDVCEVFSELDKVTPGVRGVIFSAVLIGSQDQSAFDTLSCDDHLVVKADILNAGMEVVVSMISSVAVNITWSAPSSLYKLEDLEGYLVTIHDNQNVTYFQMVILESTITVTNVTTGSCVQINAVYCGGQYSEPVFLPLISNGMNREVAGPENVTASLDCNILHIEWAGPSGRSLQDYHVDYYTITISEFILTISTEMTSVEVTLNETILTILYSFEVNVTFTICGWLSKVSAVTVDIVPVNFELVTYRMLRLNESHGSFLLKSKACRGFYTVDTIFKCKLNDNMIVVNQSSIVNVHDKNDDVSLNYILPLNRTCNGTITFWTKNKKQYTFDMIVETLSPSHFTTQANNVLFGLHFFCLFKCCDIYQGAAQTSKRGCTSLETNFAVLTDDCACDGHFTLRCDNFTVIYNQTTPDELPLTTSFIADITTETSSLVYPTETCIFTVTISNSEDQTTAFDGLHLVLLTVLVAVVLLVLLFIGMIVIMLVILKQRKGGNGSQEGCTDEENDDDDPPHNKETSSLLKDSHRHEASSIMQMQNKSCDSYFADYPHNPKAGIERLTSRFKRSDAIDNPHEKKEQPETLESSANNDMSGKIPGENIPALD